MVTLRWIRRLIGEIGWEAPGWWFHGSVGSFPYPETKGWYYQIYFCHKPYWIWIEVLDSGMLISHLIHLIPMNVSEHWKSSFINDSQVTRLGIGCYMFPELLQCMEASIEEAKNVLFKQNG